MHCPASGIRGTVFPVVYGTFICWLTNFPMLVNIEVILSLFLLIKSVNIIDRQTAVSEMAVAILFH